MALLQQISRLCDEVEELGSVYLEAAEEIETLKGTKRSVKAELKKARDELEALKSPSPAASAAATSSDRKLMKADKKTEIAKLEHQLGLLESGLARLEKKKGRVFGKREDVKSRLSRKVVDVQCGDEPVVITGPGDVATVKNMVDWIPAEPRACRVADWVGAQEVEDIRAEAERLNIKVEFPN